MNSSKKDYSKETSRIHFKTLEKVSGRLLK